MQHTRVTTDRLSGRPSGAGEILEVCTPVCRELYLRYDGDRSAAGAGQQAHEFYARLPELLESVGITLENVVTERVFLTDLLVDLNAVAEIRAQAFQKIVPTRAKWPLVSYLGQPPCVPQQSLSWQLHAIAAHQGSSIMVRHLSEAEDQHGMKVIQTPYSQHLYATQITGHGESFRVQCDSMFERAADLLQQHGASFNDAVRTWCYLDTIAENYGEFNHSRNHFFARHNVTRLPASTGIEASLTPSTCRCSLDLYALIDTVAQVRPMRAAVLNEAPEYGAAFSRGMQVEFPDKTVLYLSGTASVDRRGATAHPGDIRQQIERMLLNVQQLLAQHNGTFADVVHAINYLKSANDAPLLHHVLEQWGISNLPTLTVQAEVCRAELLCEMEAIAIVPRPTATEG